jgi:AraC-like DNA-binding protein
MPVVYRAQDEPAATREEYWRGVIDRTIGPMDIRFPAGVDRRERIATGQIGALRVTAWDSGPGEVTYASAHVRRSDPDVFHMYVHSRGRVVGEQAGRQAEIDPGDVTLVDTSLPFRCVHDASKVIRLAIPWRLLPVDQQSSDAVAGVRISGDAGPGALLSSLVRQLPGQDRLGDPELSPPTVAAAHHISVRYLHKLFAAQDATVAGFIRSRRLERSRRDLLDPARSERPVSSIAARYGFAEPAHFSRTFRAAYGSPPGEYRRLALG